MKNIWLMKKKPENHPGKDQMNLGVGMMIGKINEIQSILAKIISSDSSTTPDEAQKMMAEWNESKITFASVIKRYKNQNLFNNAKFGALDDIRRERNYFAHNYREESSEKDYRRLVTQMERIDGTLAFLKQVEMKTRADFKKKENKAKNQKKNDLCSMITDAAKQCKKDQDGDVRLADVGNVLARQGHKINGLKKECEELGIKCRDKRDRRNPASEADWYITPSKSR